MGETTEHEPMTAKRLADIGMVLEVTERPSLWHELYDEVQRLRAKRSEQREQLVTTRNERDWAITERDCARAELAAATARAETAGAALVRARQQNTDLIAAWKQGNARRDRLDAVNNQLQRSALEDALEQRTRAEQAEAECDQLRARLEEIDDGSGWTAAENAEFDKLYGTEAAMRYRAQLDCVWRIVQDLRDEAVAAGRDPYQDPMAQRLSAALVGVDAAAANVDLDRFAAKQGVKPVTSIDQLTAPKDERVSDEEWTAYAEALGLEPGKSAVVPEGDFDPDEVIAQNHADAMRDWGIAEQGDGEGGGDD